MQEILDFTNATWMNANTSRTDADNEKGEQAELLPANRRVREVIVVSSPKAGSGAGREQLPELARLIREKKIKVLETTSIDALKSRLAQHSSSELCEVVVIAAGGDGTLALVADNIPSDLALVPMPFGTENLLARYFGHTSAADDVLQTILDGKSYRLDAGRANGQLFLVMATCGFDAEVVRGLHLRRKGHISRFSYTWPIIRALRRYRFPTIQVRVSDNTDDAGSAVFAQECGWAMAFNLPRYGGFLSIEPDAIGNDGLLNVITFKARSILRGLQYFAGVALGKHLQWKEDVARQKGTTIEITSDRPVPFQLDGDYAGRLPLKIEALPGRVHLLLPTCDSKAETDD